MSTVRALLMKAEASGIKLRVDGDLVRYTALQTPSPELLAALKEHKAELLTLLRNPCPADLPADDDDYHLARLDGWQREIKTLPRPNMREGQALVHVSLDFLASEWAHKALAAGWGEIEIFGLFDGPWPAPRSRYDAQGLAPALALSMFKLAFVELNESAAILTSRTGSRLRHPRDLPGAQYCRAWWQVLRGDE